MDPVPLNGYIRSKDEKGPKHVTSTDSKCKFSLWISPHTSPDFSRTRAHAALPTPTPSAVSFCEEEEEWSEIQKERRKRKGEKMRPPP